VTRDRVAVLGGSGFVGRHIVNRLAAIGRKVVVPTRRRERAKHLILLPTVDVIEADINDRATLERMLIDADTVINLIGALHDVPRGTLARAHVDLVATTIAACKATGVSRLLHMSALHADAQGPSRYLVTKGEGEARVRESGLAWTIFRPSVIFGREDRFLNTFARLQRLFPIVALGCPGARFQPVYVGDVARCFVQSIPDDATIGQSYDICGPKVYTLRELVAYAGELSGHARPIVELGESMAMLQARVLECLPGPLMSRDNVLSMQRDSVCNGDFSARFGFTPAALEAVAPEYIAASAERSRFDDFRARSGR
jgi:NADH dehydrogenase